MISPLQLIEKCIFYEFSEIHNKIDITRIIYCHSMHVCMYRYLWEFLFSHKMQIFEKIDFNLKRIKHSNISI